MTNAECTEQEPRKSGRGLRTGLSRVGLRFPRKVIFGAETNLPKTVAGHLGAFGAAYARSVVSESGILRYCRPLDQKLL